MLRIGLVILTVLALAAGYTAWSERSGRVKAERDLGLDAARMVDAQFEKAAEVKVGTLTGKVTARAEHKGTVFTSRQTSTTPATIDYFIDLKGLDSRAYRWNAETNALTIDIPDVTVSKPNLDEARAATRQEGVFISREAALALAKQTSERSAIRASETAKEPSNLNSARANAREAITRLAREPLMAAGLRDVQVAVSFPCL